MNMRIWDHWDHSKNKVFDLIWFRHTVHSKPKWNKYAEEIDLLNLNGGKLIFYIAWHFIFV